MIRAMPPLHALPAHPRRTRMPTPRWAVSLADIGLLLLGSFALLNAMAAQRAAEGGAPAPQTLARMAADSLFIDGEARLTNDGAARLGALARAHTGAGLILISQGAATGNQRLDAFELAAARSAVAARALAQGQPGAPAPIVSVSSSAAAQPGQWLVVQRQAVADKGGTGAEN